MFRSIYRDVEKAYGLPSDTLVWSTARRAPQPPRPDPAREEAGRRLRSAAEPANFPLPQTRIWASQLPPEVRPTTLLRDFGRIANLLSLAWPDTASTYKYLHDLLVDRRGHRAGFPPEVQREIEALYRYYVEGWQSRTQLQDQQERRDER